MRSRLESASRALDRASALWHEMDEKRREMVDRGRRRSNELAESFRHSMEEYRASIRHARREWRLAARMLATIPQTA